MQHQSPAPFHRRRPVLTLVMIVVGLYVVSAALGEDEYEDYGSFGSYQGWDQNPGYGAYGAPQGYPHAYPHAYRQAYPQVYRQGYGQTYPQARAYPQYHGQGYQEPGAFRGRAEVGGMPMVSGTIDQSGGGNSVFSVGGEVLSLP